MPPMFTELIATQIAAEHLADVVDAAAPRGWFAPQKGEYHTLLSKVGTYLAACSVDADYVQIALNFLADKRNIELRPYDPSWNHTFPVVWAQGNRANRDEETVS